MNIVPQMFLVFHLAGKEHLRRFFHRQTRGGQIHRLLGYNVESLLVMPATITSTYEVTDVIMEKTA